MNTCKTPHSIPQRGHTPRAFLVAAIVVIAFGLRLWGIGFDLPIVSHPDEHHEVHRALRLGAGSFEFERNSKGGFFYLLFAEYGAYFVIQRVDGSVLSSEDFLAQFAQDPSALYLIGRATAAFLGAACVWLVYLIGRRVNGTAVGLMSAALLACCSIHAMHSHFITVDVPMTLCVLATVYFALRIVEEGRHRDYVAAGAMAALAVMTKVSAAPVVLVIALAHVLRWWGETGWFARALADRRIYICATFCLGIYVLGNPGIIVSTSSTIESNRRIWQFTNSTPVESVASYYAKSVVLALGWPLTVMSALGALRILLLHRKKDWVVLLAFPVLSLLILSTASGKWRHIRYLLPILPFMLLFASTAVIAILDRCKLSPRPKAAVIVVLLGLFCGPQLAAVIRDNIAYCRVGTPTMAMQWVQEHVPPESKILMVGEHGGRDRRYICPLRDLDSNVARLAEEIEKESPLGAMFLRMQNSADARPAFDLTVIRRDSPWPTLEEARDRGIRYVVVSVEEFIIRKGHPSRVELYNAIKADPNVRLLKKFSPNHENAYDSSKRDNNLEIYEIASDT